MRIVALPRGFPGRRLERAAVESAHPPTADARMHCNAVHESVSLIQGVRMQATMDGPHMARHATA
eukprot:5229358-Alexandrium_andersonii.AAC.1